MKESTKCNLKMKKLKIKYILLIYILGMFFTIFFKFKVISIKDYKFVINTIGVIFKNIAIVGFIYKIFTDREVQSNWRNFIES